MFGYGYRWLAASAGVSVRAVRDAVRRKALDPTDPIDCVRWIARRRGFHALAKQIEELRER